MSIQASKKPNTSYFLGIDYGQSKVGLSIADSETRIAFGYGVLKNDKNIIKKITEIIEKEGVSKIIIGNSGVETRHGVSLLAKKLNIPIEYQDEIFSTQMAERNLKEKGAKGIKKYDDQEAARIILQSWLDKK